MAVSVSNISTPSGASTEYPEGPFIVKWKDVTFDSAHAAGGEVVSASSLGYSRVVGAEVMGAGRSTADVFIGVHPKIASNGTAVFLQAYVNPAGTAVAAFAEGTADYSAYTARVKFYGF